MLKAKRNIILGGIILFISMLMVSQVSFHQGFSRGSLEWRNAKSTVYALDQKQKKCQNALEASKKEALNLKLENQQMKYTQAALKQELFSLHKSFDDITQQNALYKKILSPEHHNKDLQINSVQIYPLNIAGRFRYEVLLAKFTHHKQETGGVMQLSLQGVQNDELIQIPFEVLVKEYPQGQPFAFRYFQLLQGQLQLPTGFTPESVQINLAPKNKKHKQISEDFPWLVSIG